MRTIGVIIWRNVVSFAHRLSHDVDSLGRRVSVNSVEKNQTSVQVVTRTNLERLLGRTGVIDLYYVVLEGPDLYGAPGDFLDDPGVLLSPDRDHVPDLKRSIGLQRYSGKKISQCVLQGKSQDYAKDCRGCE